MRYRVGGLVLALSFLLTSCSRPDIPAASASPPALALSVTEEGHGVLAAQSAVIKGKGDVVLATVTMTPDWWVGGGTFKINWYAGLSQTKRFFVISHPAPDLPSYLKHPEEGVREVRVGFDGGAAASIHPTGTKAEFVIPKSARTVTQVQLVFGSETAPETVTWK